MPGRLDSYAGRQKIVVADAVNDQVGLQLGQESADRAQNIFALGTAHTESGHRDRSAGR